MLTVMKKVNLQSHYSYKHTELNELRRQPHLDKTSTLQQSLDDQLTGLTRLLSDRDGVMQDVLWRAS